MLPESDKAQSSEEVRLSPQQKHSRSTNFKFKCRKDSCMSLHYAIARRLAELVLHPAFTMTKNSSYPNAFGRLGQRLVGKIEGTPIFFSESDTSAPSSPSHIARVLAHPDWLDESKSIVYPARRRAGIGIRIEAWCDGRWYGVFVPIKRIERLNPRVAEILALAAAEDAI